MSASFFDIGKFLNSIFFAIGHSDKGESKIFDEDEVSSPPRPFPYKFGVPRELHLALLEEGKCSVALEVVWYIVAHGLKTSN